MSEESLPERSTGLDLVAIFLAGVTLLVGFSVATYHKTDPPSTLVWPATESIQNACGRVGAQISHTLLEMMGVGAYYAVASLAVLTVLLLMRRRIDQPVLRSLGWALSLLGVVTIAAMAVRDWSPGPMVGSGGYLGAMGRAWLEANFASTGAYIFAGSLLLAGLLLCTDYFMFHVAAVVTAVGGGVLVKAGGMGQSVTGQATNWWTNRNEYALADPEVDDVADDEWEYEDDGEEASEEEDEWEEVDEDDEDGEWEYEDEEEEEEADSPLKVRTPGASLAAGDDDEDYEVEEALDVGTAVAATGAAAAVAAAAGGLKDKITAALGGKKSADATSESIDEAAAPDAIAPAAEEKSHTRVKKPKTQSERDEIISQLEAADHDHDVDADYELPPLDLLLPADNVSYDEHEKEVRRTAKILEKTFKDFGFNVKVVEVETGPVIAQYEIELEAGLKLSKITGLADDLAIALRAPSVRIVAPIPGKNSVGIEVPNEHRQLVRLREVIEETNGSAKRMKIPIYLGKDVAGNSMVVDLAALPHLLIAGRTGTGKSVCLNSIILSILMSRGPDEVRMLMIDPKMVELSGYRKLPHLMHPVVTDMNKAEAILGWAVDKMEERYQLLARAGVRQLSVYNQLSETELRERIEASDGEAMDEATWSLVPKSLPYIVIVADEIADMMMTSGKEVQNHIIRLAQKSRAVGIHLILATQKPTVDVLTGLIKSNLPARIAFQVASRTDSQVVLDGNGADKLLGNGDMLFLSPGTSMLLRGQGTYLSDDEITRVVDFVGTDDQQFAAELMQLKTKEENEAEGETAAGGPLKDRDELYEAAVDIVVRERRGSVSLLQRCLGIGYGRAARLIDFMAEDKIVGEYNGSQAREVMISVEEWEIMTGGGEATDAEQAAPAVPQLAAAEPITIDSADDDTSGEADDQEEEELAEEEEWEEDETEEDAEDELEDDELADDEEWEYEDEEAAEGDEEETDEEDEELADDEEWEYEDEEEDGSEEGEEDELGEDEEWEEEEELADQV